jgi:3-hydroxyacyl-[acyl-carrier-protein] dehydratase
MSIEMLSQKIISSLPYGKTFLFVHGLQYIDEFNVIGNYSFKGDEYFYRDHFVNKHIIPGVILLEMMGQIGMVCHLSYLTGAYLRSNNFYPILSNLNADFLDPALPGESLTVKATKKYFRNNTLKSEVLLYNEKKLLIAKLDGIVKCLIDQ